MNHWRYWLLKARQEIDRSRLETVGTHKGTVHKRLTPDQAHYCYNTLRSDWLWMLDKVARSFEYQPRFSVIMPVYNTDAKWLRQAIDSVATQIYPFWELCIADDASTNPETLHVLDQFAGNDQINIIHRKRNGNISTASNDAAKTASGDYLIFMDHDDLIAPHAFFDIADLLQTNREAEIIYSDENKISVTGQFYDTHFKPDWSPALLLSYNYINHLVCMKRSLFEDVGGFRTGYDGAQDYDLLLRTCFKCQKILHLPKVLYHWRAIPGSTAKQATDKPEMATSAYKALTEYIQKETTDCRVYSPAWAVRHRLPIHQLDGPDDGPSVEIIIPTRNQGRLLLQCVESIIQKTTYHNYQILIINNESDDPETLAALSRLKRKKYRIETITDGKNGFSYAGICNQAARLSRAEKLLFLNDDTVVISERWLSRMMVYSSLPDVGVVGACLLYPDKKIQHAGVVLNMNNAAAPGHAFQGVPDQDFTYFFMGKSARECSAVTGACLLTSRKLFERLGGFDEQHFRISLNDVDYCLRSRLKYHLKTVYVPGAKLFHHESRSRQKEDDPIELAHFSQMYKHVPDRYYNPNLSTATSFTVSPTPNRMNYVRYLGRPIKILMFSHNLSLEGASSVIVDLAGELSIFDTLTTKLVSFMDGPLKKTLTEARVPVSICELPGTGDILRGWRDEAELEAGIQAIEDILIDEKPDVVVANVINSFFIINAAVKRGLPSVWIIHESYGKKELLEALPPFAVSRFEAAAVKANRMVFVSEETRKLYEGYNQFHNFTVIRNSLKEDYPHQYRDDQNKTDLRRRLNIPPDTRIILNVGTICGRKDQATLIRAARWLSKKRNDFIFILVGARKNELYCRRIKRRIKKLNLANDVLIVEETPDVHQYYQAADIFAFTSHIESYPLTILEAMAYGLPIVTTPCTGISEQVRFDVNALPFPFSHEVKLGLQLERLLDDEPLRRKMGKNSGNMWRYMPKHADMIDQYRHLVESVAQEGYIYERLKRLCEANG